MPKKVEFAIKPKPRLYGKHRTVRLPEAADQALVERAELEGKDVGWVIRDALQHYFDEVPVRKAPAATAG